MKLKNKICKNGVATLVTFACVASLSAIDTKKVLADEIKTTKTTLASEKITDQRQNEAKKEIAVTESKSAIYNDDTKLSNGKTIGEVAQALHEENALGISAEFGIFAKDKATLRADTNSSVATKELDDGVDFGTRGESHNHTTEDIHYIEHIDNLHSGAFRNAKNRNYKDSNGKSIQDHVIIDGKSYDKIEGQGGQSTIYQKDGKEFRVDFAKDKIDIQGSKDKYINLDHEFKILIQKSDSWMKNKKSDGIKTDFSDQNARTIDLTDAKADEHNRIFVNLDQSYLDAPQDIFIKGLSDKTEDLPTIIINVVDNRENQKIQNVQTKVQLTYAGESSSMAANEKHDHPNQVLWNFGSNVKELNFNSGFFMGSVLAPNAKITANVNVDGNIVGKEVNIAGGEVHRWDLVSKTHGFPYIPRFDFPVIPTPPQKKEPNKPTTPDTPKKPDKPDKPEQPTTPDKPKQPDTPKKPNNDNHNPGNNPKGDKNKPKTPTNKKPTPPTEDKPNKPKQEKPEKETPKTPDNHHDVPPKKEEPKTDKPKETPKNPTTPKSEKPKVETPPEDIPQPENPTPQVPSTPEKPEEDTPVTPPSLQPKAEVPTTVISDISEETSSTSDEEPAFYPPLAKHGQDLDDSDSSSDLDSSNKQTDEPKDEHVATNKQTKEQAPLVRGHIINTGNSVKVKPEVTTVTEKDAETLPDTGSKETTWAVIWGNISLFFAGLLGIKPARKRK